MRAEQGEKNIDCSKIINSEATLEVNTFVIILKKLQFRCKTEDNKSMHTQARSGKHSEERMKGRG